MIPFALVKSRSYQPVYAQLQCVYSSCINWDPPDFFYNPCQDEDAVDAILCSSDLQRPVRKFRL